MLEELAGAWRVTLDNGDAIWCPPAYVAKAKDKPFEVFAWTLTRPYWTSGSKCGLHQAGPELTDEEIERFIPKWTN